MFNCTLALTSDIEHYSQMNLVVALESYRLDMFKRTLALTSDTKNCSQMNLVVALESPYMILRLHPRTFPSSASTPKHVDSYEQFL
jgi:hypothetical protein